MRKKVRMIDGLVFLPLAQCEPAFRVTFNVAGAPTPEITAQDNYSFNSRCSFRFAHEELEII